MTTVDPSREESIAVAGNARSTAPTALVVVLAAILVGVVIAVIDLCADSFFLARAVWLNTADPGMYATQSTMFLPYIGLAVRGIAYVILIIEVLRVRRVMQLSRRQKESSRHRLMMIMALCGAGTVVNAVITVSMFGVASYPLTGLRDATTGEMIGRLLGGDVDFLSRLGVISLAVDVVLLAVAATCFVVLNSPVVKEYTAAMTADATRK